MNEPDELTHLIRERTERLPIEIPSPASTMARGRRRRRVSVAVTTLAVLVIAVGVVLPLRALTHLGQDAPPMPVGPSPSADVVTPYANGTIAFSSGRDSDISVVDPRGSEAVLLAPRHTSAEEGGVSLAWSPDGSELAFTDYRDDGSRGLFVVAADGGRPIDVSEELGLADRPRWSPDGNQLVFGGRGDAGYQIYVVGSDGSGLRQVSDVPDDGVSGAFTPDWSPDGSTLAWVATASDQAGNESSAIMVSSVDGSDVRTIVRSDDVLETPAWSPDGSMIAFLQKTGGGPYPYVSVVEADGSSSPIRVSRAGLNVTSEPRWHPNSGTVVFAAQEAATDNYGVYVARVEGGRTSVIYEDAFMGSPTFSPDGRWIAFVRDDAGSGLFAVSTMRSDGSDATDLVGDLSVAGAIDWQPVPVGRDGGPGAISCGADATQDLGDEPKYTADYLERWHTDDGCDVRLDYVMTRVGGCVADVDDVLVGWPIGESSAKPSDYRVYLRDPDGATQNRVPFDPSATVPPEAHDTGLRWDDYELWAVRGHDDAVWLRASDHTERWPLEDPESACL